MEGEKTKYHFGVITEEFVLVTDFNHEQGSLIVLLQLKNLIERR